ncbi:MAG: hypothetical protein ABL895_00235 [Cyclobacteriaceae bacterium]
MRSINAFLLLALIVGLSACGHNVSMETTVHEDGSLDKKIVLETEDTTKNFLSISGGSGWKMKAHLIDSANNKSESSKKWRVGFQKNFTSSEEANAELATPSDTLFRVSSTFDKKFRWFYTYAYYADTYKAINRMALPPDDYIAREDYAFIDRLPAEGQTISKADSFYLSELNKRIFDVYGLRAIYETYYELDVKLIKESGLENRWIDTLNKHKENLYALLVKQQDLPDNFIYKTMDSLGIPFPFDKMENRYAELYKETESKTNFISHASEGKYTHVINMPWTVVRTNADSVSGNRLQWNPPSVKFLLKDYTMYAEARKVNFWAFGVSALVLFFTGYLFWRRR